MVLLLAIACRPPADAERPGDDTQDSEPLPPASPWVAPNWLTEADRFTVPKNRGWTWEHDDSFSIPDMSVPQIFVAPDGRLGMMATDNLSADFRSRSVFWSEDGMEWEAGGTLLDPSHFPEVCGDRLQDATVLRTDADTWIFIAEGTLEEKERAFCATATSDLEQWSPLDAPIVVEGSTEAMSVPSALAFPEKNLLWFNNMNPAAEGGSGIGVLELDGELGATEFATDPYWGGESVDPLPIYSEGGGVRLFYTRLGNPAPGLYAVELDEGLAPPEQSTGSQAVPSPGEADPEAPAFYMDPAFVALPDGRLVLYATFGVFPDGGFEVEIHRYLATD